MPVQPHTSDTVEIHEPPAALADDVRLIRWACERPLSEGGLSLSVSMWPAPNGGRWPGAVYVDGLLSTDSVEKLLPVMLDYVLESASPLARDEIVDLAPI